MEQILALQLRPSESRLVLLGMPMYEVIDHKNSNNAQILQAAQIPEWRCSCCSGC